MQTLMLASSSKAYIFKTIESPVVPEEKSAPNRPLILLLGLILGTIFSMFIISIKFLEKIFNNLITFNLFVLNLNYEYF